VETTTTTANNIDFDDDNSTSVWVGARCGLDMSRSSVRRANGAPRPGKPPPAAAVDEAGRSSPASLVSPLSIQIPGPTRQRDRCNKLADKQPATRRNCFDRSPGRRKPSGLFRLHYRACVVRRVWPALPTGGGHCSRSKLTSVCRRSSGLPRCAPTNSGRRARFMLLTGLGRGSFQLLLGRSYDRLGASRFGVLSDIHFDSSRPSRRSQAPGQLGERLIVRSNVVDEYEWKNGCDSLQPT
jgi:hypothetical protein